MDIKLKRVVDNKLIVDGTLIKIHYSMGYVITKEGELLVKNVSSVESFAEDLYDQDVLLDQFGIKLDLENMDNLPPEVQFSIWKYHRDVVSVGEGIPSPQCNLSKMKELFTKCNRWFQLESEEGIKNLMTMPDDI